MNPRQHLSVHDTVPANRTECLVKTAVSVESLVIICKTLELHVSNVAIELIDILIIFSPVTLSRSPSNLDADRLACTSLPL